MSMTTERVAQVMAKAKAAAGIFSQFDQEQTDRIVKAVYEAAFAARVTLAKQAQAETGIGIWEHKVIKNVLASQFVYEDIRDLKTVGVISDDPRTGVTEIAQPVGPIFAIIPTTNPTSTVIFKIMIALKARNPIIISPHPRAAKSSIEAAKICYLAACRADAPDDCVQWAPDWTRDEMSQLMSHPDLALVLATGGGAMVKAAYSSGKPALGVGAGNVPAYIEKSADVVHAVTAIMASKTFDNGTVCASEQAIIVEKSNAAAARRELEQQGAYFLPPADVARVEAVALDPATHVMHPAIVGKSAAFIAELAGISVPDGTRLLVAPLHGVGREHPLSAEVLAPVIAWYEVKDFAAAGSLCLELNFFGGMGHTASIHSNDRERILAFATLMNAGRVVVNSPSSQGAVGGICNFLPPSFTLGCGTGGNNITTDNISARHLINIQRVARRRGNERLDRFDMNLLYDEKLDAPAIARLYNKNY
ncbi:MAG TPA: aldehyde dehydrogenase family protein [bacterium]|nr:aldehyde dehydrogenase family protein [bacterium]